MSNVNVKNRLVSSLKYNRQLTKVHAVHFHAPSNYFDEDWKAGYFENYPLNQVLNVKGKQPDSWLKWFDYEVYDLAGHEVNGFTIWTEDYVYSLVAENFGDWHISAIKRNPPKLG